MNLISEVLWNSKKKVVVMAPKTRFHLLLHPDLEYNYFEDYKNVVSNIFIEKLVSATPSILNLVILTFLD